MNHYLIKLSIILVINVTFNLLLNNFMDKKYISFTKDRWKWLFFTIQNYKIGIRRQDSQFCPKKLCTFAHSGIMYVVFCDSQCVHFKGEYDNFFFSRREITPIAQ